MGAPLTHPPDRIEGCESVRVIRRRPRAHPPQTVALVSPAWGQRPVAEQARCALDHIVAPFRLPALHEERRLAQGTAFGCLPFAENSHPYSMTKNGSGAQRYARFVEGLIFLDPFRGQTRHSSDYGKRIGPGSGK